MAGRRNQGGQVGGGSRRAARASQASDGTSPAPVSEGSLGVSLLRLGALGRRTAGEDLVLELCSDVEGALKSAPPPPASSTGASWADESEGHPHRPIVEHDLRVQEYFSDDDPSWRGSGAAIAGGVASAGARFLAWAPGSTAGRRLMEARSRRCVICLAEKEHTLVPPHRARVTKAEPATASRLPWLTSSSSSALSAPLRPNQQVEDHRFCTDCWETYLRHVMRQEANSPAGRPPHDLLCPVCRGVIDVPDVYSVRLELPDAWQLQCAPPSAPLPLPEVSVSEARPRRCCWWRSRPASALWAWRHTGTARAPPLVNGDHTLSLVEQRDPILGGSTSSQASWWQRVCGARRVRHCSAACGLERCRLSWRQVAQLSLVALGLLILCLLGTLLFGGYGLDGSTHVGA